MLILFLFSFSLFASPNPGSCELGGYNYNGGYMSDSYSLPSIPPTETACKSREDKNAPKLGLVYKSNNDQIMEKIDEIMKDPRCKPLQEILQKYLDILQAMKLQHNLDHRQRMELLEKTWTKIDIQRNYAHVAAFSATCSGQEHRTATIVDLDAINEIAGASGESSKITQNGQVAENCSNVVANGSGDLKNFKVNMKQAKGDTFLFEKDAYTLRDQVILKSGGNTLYDSGCDAGFKSMPVKVSQLGRDKMLTVEIVGSCDTPTEEGKARTAWFVKVACQMPPAVCPDKVNDLLVLLKQEVEYTKEKINIHSNELSCYKHYDQNVLKDLVKNGWIRLSETPWTNGPCRLFDEECINRRKEMMEKELKGVSQNRTGEHSKSAANSSKSSSKSGNEGGSGNGNASGSDKDSGKESGAGTGSDHEVDPKSGINADALNKSQDKNNSTDLDSHEIYDNNCPPKIRQDQSVLKLMSRTYCRVGFRRLGFNLDSFK